MSQRDEEGTEGFTVRDKRRFDAAGNERRDEEPRRETVMRPPREEPAPSAATAQATEVHLRESFSKEASGSAELGDGEPPALDFASFVLSLATQALWQLGVNEPPPGMEVQKDIEGARQTIDIISLLKTKTKGNLTASEERLIEEVLHELRMVFVRASA